MQAALIKLALVRKLPFGPQMAEGLPLLGDHEGGFKRHLGQALARLLGGPPRQEQDDLPPAVSALRRALERAGSAGGAIVEQALRPLLDKILAADGYSWPQREQVLELSQVEEARIDLATLFELAAATRLVAFAGLGCKLEERPRPEAVRTRVQAAGKAGCEARPQAETAEGVLPAGAQVASLPAGLKAAVEQGVARAQEEPEAGAGPKADKAQPAPGAQGRPPGEAVAAGRGGAAPPGLEVARAIQEVLSATLPRAAPPQRRGLDLAGQPLVKGAGRRREAAGADLEVRAAADKLSAPGAIERSVPGPEPSPGPGPSPELVREVAHQVERAITTGLDRGEGRLRLRLKLAELGELRLDLSLRGEHLKVVLVAETSAARDTLQAGLPELRHCLAEQGLRLEQFSVFVRQEGGFPHHSPGWGQGTGGSLAAEVSAVAEGPETGAVLAAGRLAAGRIDLFC